MPRTKRATVTRNDWIVAGQELLREGGAPAVRLAALTARLGVTSGSFYHHFRDFGEYRDALADFYGGEHVLNALTTIGAEPDPARRLHVMYEIAEAQDIAALDLAMRVWGTTNDRARAAVARLDSTFLEVARGAFRDLGFSTDEARLRALVAFAAGVGSELVMGERFEQAGDRRRALELLGAPYPK